MLIKGDIGLQARRYLLIIVDVVIISTILAIYLKYFYSFETPEIDKSIKPFQWFVLLTGLWFLFSSFFNLNKKTRRGNKLEILKTTLIVSLITGFTYLFIPFISPVFPQNRTPALIFLIGLSTSLTLWRYAYLKLFSYPLLTRKVLIVGAGEKGRSIARLLTNNVEHVNKTAYHLFGFVDDHLPAGTAFEGYKVVCGSNDLLKYATRLKLDELILAIKDQGSIEGKMLKVLSECKQNGVDVNFANLIYENLTGKVQVFEEKGNYTLGYVFDSGDNNKAYLFLNRLLNIFFGIVGVSFLILIIPFLFLINFLFNKGDLFYHQTRVGKNNKNFEIYKFRTMIQDAEKVTGPVWATSKDDRITKVGGILRKTRIDELPQFWNILKGEMNLIGPRPERPNFVEQLEESIPFFRLRHLVKPGITGWAQVNNEYASSEEDSLNKLQYDLFYIKHRSFFMDLNIVSKTISVMLKFKGT